MQTACESVISDIQGRLANGRPPSDETEDDYYDRYEVDEAHGDPHDESGATFKIMDYATGASFWVTIRVKNGGYDA